VFVLHQAVFVSEQASKTYCILPTSIAQIDPQPMGPAGSSGKLVRKYHGFQAGGSLSDKAMSKFNLQKHCAIVHLPPSHPLCLSLLNTNTKQFYHQHCCAQGFPYPIFDKENLL